MTLPDDRTAFRAIIDESIQLELNISELYFLFFEFFPEHAEFWWKLVEEEKNHAALIRSGLEYFEPMHRFPDRMIDKNIDEIISVNTELHNIIAACREHHPDQRQAFNTAYTLEQSAGELHFQRFIDSADTSDPIEKIFIRLNRDDHRHAERIESIMRQLGIPIDKSLSLI